jgi:site-specific DNA recombinase
MPELRIVDDDLWNAVAARTSERQRLTGTKKHGPKARYFLSGFSRCAECGGPIKVAKVKASYENVNAYACAWFKDRGTTVCRNSLRRPVAAVDAAVLEWIREHVLREEVILEALAELRRRLVERTATASSDVPEIQGQIRAVKAEIEKLSAALLSTSDPPATIVTMIADREKRLVGLQGRLAAIQSAPAVLNLEVKRMEREARARVASFAELMSRNAEHARKALACLLSGPMKFTPVETRAGKRFRIEGELALEAMFLTEGTADGSGACPTGSVPSGIRTRVTALKGLGPGPD